MKIFFILYIVGIILSFSFIYINALKNADEFNNMFVGWYNPATISIYKILGMSLIFPILLLIVLLDFIFINKRL